MKRVLCTAAILTLAMILAFSATAQEQGKALLDAAITGDLSAVQRMLQSGVSPDVKDATGRTPLHLAAAGGHRTIAENLLAGGADINATDNSDKTPLDMAVIGAHTGMTQFLEGKGGERSAASENIVTPRTLQPSLNSVADDGKRLFEAATRGDSPVVREMLEQGMSANILDDNRRTPLHLAAARGHASCAEALVEAGAEVNPLDNAGNTPLDFAGIAGHSRMIALLVDKGGRRSCDLNAPPGARLFHPDVQLRTADAFGEAIGEPAVLVDSENICIMAPKRREDAARIVLPYLARAYDELYIIVGVHTKYKMLVYAYPQGFPGVRGGTSGCVIRYDDQNLDLNSFEEWTRYHVPHVSGYIEEMAHNFVTASGARFTSEMVGWSISAKVSDTVARNPIHQRELARVRRVQDETYRRYIALGQTVPPDVPENLADRIHAHLLRKCELKYGPDFWSDFFAEVRKQHDAFFAPEALGDGPGRDVRYRITIDCFDRLPGIEFKKLLEENGVSTTVDLSSLNFSSPNWDRKLH